MLGLTVVTVLQNGSTREEAQSLRVDAVPGLVSIGRLMEEALRCRVIGLRHILSSNAAEMAVLDREAEASARAAAGVLEEHEKTITRDDERGVFARIAPACPTCAAEELNAQAGVLRDAVKDLQRLVGGDSSASLNHAGVGRSPTRTATGVPGRLPAARPGKSGCERPAAVRGSRSGSLPGPDTAAVGAQPRGGFQEW